MTANMKILEEEKLRLSRYIKAKVQEEGQTVKGVVNKMNELYKDRIEYLPGTINQINAANMPYWKIVRFAAALGYEIKWERKEN